MANQKTKVIWVLCFIFPFASKEKQLITQTNQSTVLNIMLSFLSFSYIFLPTKHRRINTPNSQNQTTKTLNLKPCFYNETKTPKKNPSLRHSVGLLRKRKERRKTRKNEIKVLPFLSSEPTHWKLRFLKKKTPGKPMYI